MEAIVLEQFGGPEKLQIRTLPTPEITSKQILVKRLAVAIEPYDVKFAAGLAGDYDLPVVMGSSIVGEVVAIGSEVAKVNPVKLGDRIVAAPHLKAYAEFMAIGQKAFTIIPATISDTVAVSLAIAGQTAYQMINEQLQPQSEEVILIHGGAGAVGYTAIQLALLRGAKVYTTASQRHQAKLAALGDVTVIDYHRQTLAEVIQRVDYVLDTVGGVTLEASLALLAPSGKLVSLVDDPNKYKQTGVNAQQVYMKSRGVDLAKILALVEAGKLTSQIDREVTFSLANIKLGYQLSKSGQLNGKYVLH